MAIRAALGAGSARVTRQLLVESLLLGLSRRRARASRLPGCCIDRCRPAARRFSAPRRARRRRRGRWPSRSSSRWARASSSGCCPSCACAGSIWSKRWRRTATAPVGAGVRSRTARARLLMMSGQVTIACVLLVGASLLGRSFLALLNADRGYDPSPTCCRRGYRCRRRCIRAAERRFAIIEQVLERLAAMPGVTEASFTSELPLTPGGSTSAFNLKSLKADGGIVRVQASPRIVSPRYFSALRIRDHRRPRLLRRRHRNIRAGRRGQPGVCAPIPRRLAARREGARWRMRLPTESRYRGTVIGVVDDVRYVTAGTARSRSCTTPTVRWAVDFRCRPSRC